MICSTWLFLLFHKISDDTFIVSERITKPNPNAIGFSIVLSIGHKMKKIEGGITSINLNGV